MLDPATMQGEQISIHAPARGATVYRRRDRRRRHNFNPRTREGCDLTAGDQHRGRRISIHAPARGATLDVEHTYYRTDISIHAPARGATARWRTKPAPIAISIHAPARGATPARFAARRRARFQSTHPRGVRPLVIVDQVMAKKFQSTHPRGVRPLRPLPLLRSLRISIHAPARGATNGRKQVTNAAWAFQSTHPRGVRRTLYSAINDAMVFQSTHPRGVRPLPNCCHPRSR